MFRLTEHCTSGGLVLKLEGRCSRDVLGELEAGWQSAADRAGGHGICIDVSDLLVVDDAGRERLARMHAAGARFVSRGCLMRELIRQITQTP
jgi:anti-anti-sigma regulatory factor